MPTDAAYGAPETRRRILDATWELVTEQGAQLKLADVAARASGHRVGGASPALVDPVGVVQLARSVEAEPDRVVVGGERLAPL